MSFPTTPAFTHHGSWSDETREHPAMKFMEWYTTEIIDVPGGSWDKPATDCGMASDWSYKKSTGQEFSGADEAWSALRETYAPFKEHVHDPKELVTWESADDWVMYGVADLWYNLQAPGEGGIKGYGGKQWDGVVPSAFKFTYRKGGKHGVELTRTEVYSDPSALLVQMLKRGMLKPEQLMG